jgi:hypothetical protein
LRTPLARAANRELEPGCQSWRLPVVIVELPVATIRIYGVMPATAKSCCTGRRACVKTCRRVPSVRAPAHFLATDPAVIAIAASLWFIGIS